MKKSLQVQGVKWLLLLKPRVGPGRVLGQGSNTLGFYLRKFTQTSVWKADCIWRRFWHRKLMEEFTQGMMKLETEFITIETTERRNRFDRYK